jgi:hypothetical protein
MSEQVTPQEQTSIEVALEDSSPKPSTIDLDSYVPAGEDKPKKERKEPKRSSHEEDDDGDEEGEKASSDEDTPKAKKDKEKGPRYWTKEEWEAAGKDPAKYKSKEQFEHDGQYFKKIEELNKTIKKLETRLYQEDKAKFENHKRELENQRFQAIAQADPYTTYQLEQQLYSLQEPEAPVYEEEVSTQNEFVEKITKADRDFEERNASWLTDRSFEAEEMREYAKELAERRINELRGQKMDPEELITLIEQELKRQYPHRFEDSTEDDDDDYEDDTSNKLDAIREELADLKETKKYPTVESNSYSKSKVTARDIPREYRDIYLSMPEEDRKAMPPAKYIKKLKEYGVA